MVSETRESSPPASSAPRPSGEKAGASDEAWSSGSVAGWHRANRGGLRRLVASTVRLADLQIQIWVTQAKMTVARVAAFVILCAAAGLMAILGTIFLLIGLFRILTDEFGLQPVWAFLIFGGFLFVMAGGAVMIARQTLVKKADKKKAVAQQSR
jgi:hypothetical protein